MNHNHGMINPLPPSYIEPNNIHTWLGEIFDSPFGLPCICSDQTPGADLHAVRPQIISICQRVAQPCIIDIQFHLGTAWGIYHYQPNSSGFSFDTTDGKDGTWHQLVPDITSTSHNPSPNNTTLAMTNSVDATWNYSSYDPSLYNGECDITPAGIVTHVFTFDMCEHVSTWMQEPEASFRLSFDKQLNAVVPEISCGIQFI